MWRVKRERAEQARGTSCRFIAVSPRGECANGMSREKSLTLLWLPQRRLTLANEASLNTGIAPLVAAAELVGSMGTRCRWLRA